MKDITKTNFAVAGTALLLVSSLLCTNEPRTTSESHQEPQSSLVTARESLAMLRQQFRTAAEVLRDSARHGPLPSDPDERKVEIMRRLLMEGDTLDAIMGFERRPLPTADPPHGLTTAVEPFSTLHLFRIASGYYISLNNHPTLYAAIDSVHISAAQYERSYPLSQLHLAVADYIETLRSHGYAVQTEPASELNPQRRREVELRVEE